MKIVDKSTVVRELETTNGKFIYEESSDGVVLNFEDSENNQVLVLEAKTPAQMQSMLAMLSQITGPVSEKKARKPRTPKVIKSISPSQAI